jgi:hypothetical protein
MRMHGWKMHVPYERMIHSSWGRRSLVEHQKPWLNCVCGPSIVLLCKLVIYCRNTSVILVLVYIQFYISNRATKEDKIVNPTVVLIEVRLDGHLKWLKGYFTLMLYHYNKFLYQEKELNTSTVCTAV